LNIIYDFFIKKNLVKRGGRSAEEALRRWRNAQLEYDCKTNDSWP